MDIDNELDLVYRVYQKDNNWVLTEELWVKGNKFKQKIRLIVRRLSFAYIEAVIQASKTGGFFIYESPHAKPKVILQPSLITV